MTVFIKDESNVWNEIKGLCGAWITEAKDIDDVPYDYPSAHLKCYLKNGSTVSLFGLNHKSEGEIRTSFTVPNGCVKCSFIPQNDLAACISIREIKIGDKSVPVDNVERYYLKNQSVIDLEISGKDDCRFDARWSVNN